MKQIVFIPFLILTALSAFAQTKIILSGRVLDATTKEPLSFATIGVKLRQDQTITNALGDFTLAVPPEFVNDSLTVSFIGYTGFAKRIADLKSPEIIYLKESYTLLKEVVVAHRKLNLREVDKSLRMVKDNLYAMETEVTNGDFNHFLNYLEEFNQTAVYDRCVYDVSKYKDSEKEFFRRYSGAFQAKPEDSDSLKLNHNDFPAVNISHEAAIQYCAWLTDQYNSSLKKRKFKKVKFRLPTLKEWQITALGYPKFQSWELGENVIEVIIPKNDTIEHAKGPKKPVTVDKDILYPWWEIYNYRKSPTNSWHCFLGNFLVNQVDKPCVTKAPGYDYWIMMARCASYFPNRMGFYDTVGNVAEMIDAKGVACGGSWNDPPEESTIWSTKQYSKPDKSVGFRVFMEVLEN